MNVYQILTMKIIFSLVVSVLLFSTAYAEDAVLVFSKTKGFRHKSIEVAKPALIKMGAANKFRVDTTEDASVFSLANLKKYKAVVFLSTTGDVLDEAQQNAFQQYIKQGGSYVGIHAAADTEYDWPWYNQLCGAYFLSHPKQQNAEFDVVNKNHISTKMLPDQWKRYDELYNYKDRVEGTTVLIKLNEKTYEGGANGDNHPIAWYREFDGGRTFYTGLGHTDEAYSETLFMDHLLGGIKWAMGRKK